MIKSLYTLFMGIMLALFVGVGIATFYSQPERPEELIELERENITAPTENQVTTPEVSAKQDRAEALRDDYQSDLALYNRNVSLFAIAAALVLMAASLILASRIKTLADSFLLGGVFTLIYSIIRGFQADDTTYRFILVSIGLIIGFALGYNRFLRPAKQAPAPTPSTSNK